MRNGIRARKNSIDPNNCPHKLLKVYIPGDQNQKRKKDDEHRKNKFPAAEIIYPHVHIIKIKN